MKSFGLCHRLTKDFPQGNEKHELWWLVPPKVGKSEKSLHHMFANPVSKTHAFSQDQNYVHFCYSSLLLDFVDSVMVCKTKREENVKHLL